MLITNPLHPFNVVAQPDCVSVGANARPDLDRRDFISADLFMSPEGADALADDLKAAAEKSRELAQAKSEVGDDKQ
jgi:hypothetical protein